jgi:hypothetical protein
MASAMPLRPEIDMGLQPLRVTGPRLISIFQRPPVLGPMKLCHPERDVLERARVERSLPKIVVAPPLSLPGLERQGDMTGIERKVFRNVVIARSAR